MILFVDYDGTFMVMTIVHDHMLLVKITFFSKKFVTRNCIAYCVVCVFDNMMDISVKVFSDYLKDYFFFFFSGKIVRHFTVFD